MESPQKITNRILPYDQAIPLLGIYPKGLKQTLRNFSGGAVVKNLSANAWDKGLISGLGRSHMW